MKFSPRNALAWIDDALDALESQSLRRRRETHSGSQCVRLQVGGRELINFGSNDYLGLAADPRLAAAARTATELGCGAGASPLVTGRAMAHEHLERRLAEFEGTQAALLFTSGYAANQGTIAALAGPADAIYSDAKNHASIIDGCRVARAAVEIYPHRDCGALEARLRAGSHYPRRLIVTESVFSMDGDLAPLVELAELAARFDCMLLVDEAHATGVFGRQGRGLAEQLEVEDRVHVRVGTLSKALGCAGGFVAGSEALVEWLINRARSYVFSTAAPPLVSAAAAAALDVVRDEPQRRVELLARAAALRDQLRSDGWDVGDSESQIIPLAVGEAAHAVQLAGRLREKGLLVPAIRPPSVPPQGSLLRISLSTAHTPEMIARLSAALAAVR